MRLSRVFVAYVVDPDYFDYFVRRLHHTYEVYKITHDHLHGDALQIFRINQFIQGAGSSTKAFKKVFKVFQLVCSRRICVTSSSMR